MYTIYSLTDPRTHVVRYVGCTSTSLPRRFANHIWFAKRGDNKMAVCAWIRELLDEALKPVISPLELDARRDRERHWVEQLNPDLNFIHTPEGDEFQSNRAHELFTNSWKRPESRARCIAALRNRRYSPEQCQKMGARLNEGRIKAVRERQYYLQTPCGAKGINNYASQHPERVQGSKNPMSRLTESNVEDIRLMRQQGQSRTVVARKFGIHIMTVSRITAGKRWAHTVASPPKPRDMAELI